MRYCQKAFAKINLSLDVLSKREDGYHEVSMLMHQISLSDTVTLTCTDSEGIQLSTDSDLIPTDESNIAFRAAKLLTEKFHLKKGVAIHIEKKIPIAGGLAGGSTDAAAVLCLMNTAFGLNLSKEELMDIGLMLGADVPYCIFGAPALAEGIGEKLTKVSGLPECQILIVNPGVQISTKEIYEEIDHTPERKRIDNLALIHALEEKNLEKASRYMINQMEPVAAKKCKQIPAIIERLKACGAIHAMMSGSGATCFGLFPQDADLTKIIHHFAGEIAYIATPQYEI